MALMVYLFHGAGSLGMLNKISSIKKNFDSSEIIELSSKYNSLGEVVLSFQSISLFGEKKLLILQDFTDIDFSILPSDPNVTTVLTFSKNLPSNSSLLKEAQKLKVQVIPFPEEKETSIFPFLDMLCERNPKALSELEKYLDEWGEQYVFTMMAYSLRRFVQSSKKVAPFALKKMESQRKNFPLERVRELYREIIETDFRIKQGQIEAKMGAILLAEKFLRVG